MHCGEWTAQKDEPYVEGCLGGQLFDHAKDYRHGRVKFEPGQKPELHTLWQVSSNAPPLSKRHCHSLLNPLGISGTFFLCLCSGVSSAAHVLSLAPLDSCRRCSCQQVLSQFCIPKITSVGPLVVIFWTRWSVSTQEHGVVVWNGGHLHWDGRWCVELSKQMQRSSGKTSTETKAVKQGVAACLTVA
eukprot:1282009-Amphidinium_carterae.1